MPTTPPTTPDNPAEHDDFVDLDQLATDPDYAAEVRASLGIRMGRCEP